MTSYRRHDRGDPARPSLAETLARYPEQVVRLSLDEQSVIELSKRGMSSMEIGIRLNMTAARVRKHRQRARDKLLVYGKTLRCGCLLACLVWIRSLLAGKGGVVTGHANAASMVPVAGAMTAAMCVGLLNLDVDKAHLVPEVLSNRIVDASQTVGTPETHVMRQVAGDVVTPMRARRGVRPSETLPMKEDTGTRGVPLPARGELQLSPNLAGGEQAAHEFSVDAPVGKVAVGGESKATGAALGSVACREGDGDACRKEKGLAKLSYPNY